MTDGALMDGARIERGAGPPADGPQCWLPEMRPRERLAALGVHALSPQELLALVIGEGCAGAPAPELARRLLVRAGGLRALGRRNLQELAREAGLGPAKAARLAAAFELGRRVAVEEGPQRVLIRGGADVHRLLGPRLRDQRKETVWSLLLDGRNRLLREERVSEGTLTSSVVHPREVFGPAIREAAAAVIVVHNHPSGDPTPSREDLEVTRRLAQVGELVGIELVDHVIVGDAGYVSLRDLGHLDGPR